MNRTQTIGVLFIGILMYPVFPGNGIQILITKLVERVFFNTLDNSMLSYILSTLIGLILALYIFNYALQMILTIDFTISGKIKTWIKYGVLINVFLFIIWFTIPFIDHWLGANYNSNLVSNYNSLKSTSYLLTPTTQILSFMAGLWMVYRKVNSKSAK